MTRFRYYNQSTYEGYEFFCPGCKCCHLITTKGKVQWTVSGEGDLLTFKPSLRCNPHHKPTRCHSFIKEGQIQFLSDCHHELAGQTVDIPEWDH